MPIRFVPDNADEQSISGVDRHYYEAQVPPSSPGNDTSFKRAAAVAKDRARHQLIRAVLEEDRKARGASFTGLDDTSVQVKRQIDGIEGATDDAIKL